ncbi:phosphotransferase [Nocardioides lacusdianchii]|uniref:phosphotransferase n=1 Tax=Nocardioides lacusdianchii TaxID=2783664 RepID=UPI001CCC6352|nr:phosphotransferase [Nocardioides lacusdianchii]
MVRAVVRQWSDEDGGDPLDAIAEVFELGRPTAVRPVTGGLSNEMWKLDTSTGAFAVKVMRAHTDEPGFRDNIERAHAIEAAAFRRGVPCPEPMLAAGGDCLAVVAGDLVRVHRWVEGRPVQPYAWLEEVGELTARIHNVSEHFDDVLDDEPRDEETWAGLADHAEMPHLLAQHLRRAAPRLAELEAHTAANGVRTRHASSHGDLDPKNALSVGDTLVALDWDAAGPQSVIREASTVALDWSTDPRGFQRVIAAYGRTAGVFPPAEPWVLGGWVAAWGGWLVHHASR